MLKFIKININFKQTSLAPPSFLGSILRGALGYALKRVVCINPSYECNNCFAKDNCLFYDFYEKKNSFHPFRFDFKLNQEKFDFSLYLFEEATEKIPYILSSLHKLFNEIGIGKDRKKLTIDTIRCNDTIVFKENKFIDSALPKEFQIDSFSSNATIEIITPLRMKYQNRLLKTKPPLEVLLQSIYNRYLELKQTQRAKLPFTPSYQEKENKIFFRELTRYSNRQKTKMQLGGIMGKITYENLDRQSFELLKLGEILGVGKQTVFGLGKIEVKEGE